MANDPHYDAVISRARVHLHRAWEAFSNDPAIPWDKLKGDVPKAQTRAWIDALKADVAHHEQRERLL